MVVTLINDCSDSNAFGRQVARIGSYIPNSTINTVGLNNYSEFEAAGNLIDIIDAYEENKGIIIVNSAPRHGPGKKFSNGTPFGYFYYKNLLIVSSVDGFTLSLAKKLNLIDKFFIVDIPTVLNFAFEKNLITQGLVEYISNTQFRSFDFEPRLAKWLNEKVEVPSEIYPLENIADIKNQVWLVDNFGNIKTSLVVSDYNFEIGKTYSTSFGEVKFYNRLKDVPNGESAIISGSSGISNKRFLEIVIQGKNAAETFGLKTGDEFEINI